MQALTWLTSVLATTATARAQATTNPYEAVASKPAAALPAAVEAPSRHAGAPLEMQPPGYHAAMWQQDTVQVRQAELSARAVAGYGNLATRNSKCLDVPSGQFRNNQPLQIWACDSNNANQGWKISGTQLRTANNMCLDVPNGSVYYGAPLQIYACSASGTNPNQMFESVNNAIRKRGTNWCVDVKDGHYSNGGQLQLWTCDWNLNGNQYWTLGTPAQVTTQSPSSFLGYGTISWPSFLTLHPELNPWGQDFQNAAAANGLVPTLLGALAATESSFQERPGNGWGMFQFSSDAAWRQFGDGGDRQNARDAAWAAARYMRFLLNQDGQNLDQALRDYNGPLSQGGNPNYQTEIRTWMAGGSPW